MLAAGSPKMSHHHDFFPTRRVRVQVWLEGRLLLERPRSIRHFSMKVVVSRSTIRCKYNAVNLCLSRFTILVRHRCVRCSWLLHLPTAFRACVYKLHLFITRTAAIEVLVINNKNTANRRCSPCTTKNSRVNKDTPRAAARWAWA